MAKAILITIKQATKALPSLTSLSWMISPENLKNTAMKPPIAPITPQIRMIGNLLTGLRTNPFLGEISLRISFGEHEMIEITCLSDFLSDCSLLY